MWNLENLEDDAMELLQNHPERENHLEHIKNIQNGNRNELFDYVYDLIQDLKIFEGESFEFNAIYRKSNIRSYLLREEAILLATQSKWQEALEKFTMSIAYAVEQNNLVICQLYCLRARHFLKELFHEECVRDIRRAQEYKPSGNLKEELDQLYREASPFLPLESSLDSYNNHLPAVSTTNKHIKCASSGLKIITEKKKNRYLVATRNIPIGEVLAVEDPYVLQIDPSQEYLHCNQCLKLCYDLIPCLECPRAMYCSYECRQQACDGFHEYECKLYITGLKKPRLFVIMTLKMAITFYDDTSSLEDLSIEDIYAFRANRHTEISNMRTNAARMTPTEWFQALLEPIVFYNYLTERTPLLHKAYVGKKVLKKMFVNNFLIARTNMTTIQKIKDTNPLPIISEDVGCGIYTFYSVNIEHSCFCNTKVVFYGSKMVIHAIRNIKKGERITTSYNGLSFHNQKLTERKALLEKLNYHCKCTACEENWSARKFLKEGPPYDPLEKIIQNFCCGRFNCQYIAPTLMDTFQNSLKSTGVPTRNYLVVRGFYEDLVAMKANAAKH